VKEKAVQSYWLVKEDIKFAIPYHWGSPEQTWRGKKGQCGMKSEVLVTMLRDNGIKARYVEGRLTGLRSTWMERLLCVLGLVLFDVHIWVEALIGNKWLVLDPTPDSGIAPSIGDTKPGTHLGSPKQIARYDEIPLWYKDGHNMKTLLPLKLTSNFELSIRRFISKGVKS
jgi:hypothetical protein